jgi:general nucleoside transport system ATP-binding protein
MTLELRDVHKAFGSVLAVDGVDVEFRRGEVHALVGENGAGKSTVVNLMSGAFPLDGGEIRLDGAPAGPLDRRRALALGVGVVHQHPSFVETMTIAENVELGGLSRRWRADLPSARALITDWAERTGLQVSPDVKVKALSMGERQRAEIVAALVWGANYLVLDEPTAVLSPFEADGLLDVVEQLARDGLAVVLVTHKLREVERSADRVTVMRSGRVVARHERGGFTKWTLAADMVGEGAPSPEVAEVHSPSSGEERLRLEGIQAGRLKHLDLVVKAGEIVAIAGVAGNGQRELADIATGLLAPTQGRVLVDGVEITGHAAAAVRRGVAVVPDDRDGDALALGLALWANVVAKRRSGIGSWRGLDRAAIARLTDDVIARLAVKPARRDLRAGALSGGNRQRLVIGRELAGDTSVAVVAEPTRGLDPASAAAVLQALVSTAQAGAAVLVIASDLDELLAIATRVVVLADGMVRLDRPRCEVDRATVGEAMLAVSA